MRKLNYVSLVCTMVLGFSACKNNAVLPQNAVSTGADNSVASNNGRLTTMSASDNRVISFESASLSGTNYYLTDSSFTYAFITKGTYSNPVLTTSEHFKGTASIAYQMPHTTVSGSVTNDKSQHRIFSGSDANAMGFGVKKYFGFAVKLDNLTEQPTANCQLFQVWQGTPMSPPVELCIVPGGSGSTFNIRLAYRNNTTTANPSASIAIYTGTIQKGVWNTFVLMTIMRNTADTQDGELKLWLNSTQVVDWFGRAGYADGIVYAGNSYTPNTKFDTFFGPYRPCQLANLKMYYDQVKYGGAYTEADPNL